MRPNNTLLTAMWLARRRRKIRVTFSKVRCIRLPGTTACAAASDGAGARSVI